MVNKRRLCNGCNVVEYIENKPFKCPKCKWEVIIEQDENGENIQIN